MSRRLNLVAAGVFAVAFYVCIFGSDFPASAQPSLTRDVARETFLARCSTCHAEHGEGSEAGASLNVPDLRSSRVQQLDDVTLRQIIQEGRGDMPKFKRDFNDEEISRLVKLVRSFAARSEEAKTPESQAKSGREK